MDNFELRFLPLVFVAGIFSKFGGIFVHSTPKVFLILIGIFIKICLPTFWVGIFIIFFLPT